MSFLTPAFFLGALALAIPVIIHLTNREKKEVVDFPSLMFLRRIPYRSVRRQRLRHLLLFALRCLALLLLILAFARPFFDSPTAASALPLGPREVVFVLDHSYSMGYENRLERAKDEIRGQIGALAPDERASFVVFSDRAEISNQPTSDKDQLNAIVNSVTLSARTTRYGPALKLAKKIVDESSLTRKEVVLLSDFQRLGWEGDEDVWFPANTSFTPIDVGSPTSDNLAVTGVILERNKIDQNNKSSDRERLVATARVTYKAPDGDPPLETNIKLELNGRSLQSKKLRLTPNSSDHGELRSVDAPQRRFARDDSARRGQTRDRQRLSLRALARAIVERALSRRQSSQKPVRGSSLGDRRSAVISPREQTDEPIGRGRFGGPSCGALERRRLDRGR